MTRMTPELTSPLLTSAPHQREEVWHHTYDLAVNSHTYKDDLQWERVSNVEPCCLQDDILPLGHCTLFSVSKIDNSFGLASNITTLCKNFKHSNVFCTSEKVKKFHEVNMSLVLGLRLIGKAHVGTKKLCTAMNLNVISKVGYKKLENKLSNACMEISKNVMHEAAGEISKSNFDISHVENQSIVHGKRQDIPL
ncbi:hypothetical protein AVEN_64887-1 [Araneus ventricosus]|uniref:Mutator-like transposase domain-containing protein n=1 Tax=Araneus ventricosus TaxID=182803 RepID=A0A4Y2J6D0_ARAVE|nr:hypothetical protein AVEN_64887-1 [Araneus ventricosus]